MNSAPNPETLLEPMAEMHDIIIEMGGSDLDLCFQCGQCTATCPWGRVRDHKVRHMLHLAQMGVTGFEDEIWLCATCEHCAARCHRGVDIPEVIRTARKVMLEGGGKVEDGLKFGLSSLDQQGNPFMEDEAKRNQWAQELAAPSFEPGMEFLLYTCCENSFQDHNRDLMGSVLKLLKVLEVDFGVLDSREHCCGDVAYRVGSEEQYTKAASHNIDLFNSEGVQSILTMSPHCMQQLATHYSGLGGNFEVQHIVELLHEKLAEGKLTFTRPVNMTVAYHDPCYLGRHAGIYDQPRALLEAVPGLKLVELDKTCDEALCCGGGGGRMFLETAMQERFSNQRVQAALDAGAEALVTACPYCICNFDDSILTMEVQDQLQIKEICEILAAAEPRQQE